MGRTESKTDTCHAYNIINNMFNQLNQTTMTEHQDKFAIKVYTDGREEFLDDDVQTYTNYEQAKKRLKEIADDFAYGFVQLGRTITCRCTFGGFSKDATPLTEDDRKQFPDAVLIHIQRVRSSYKNRETRVIYSLNII